MNIPLPHFCGASATLETISHGLGSRACLHLAPCPLLHHHTFPDDLSGILPAQTGQIPCHFCLYLAINILQQCAKQTMIPPPKWCQPHPCE